MGGRDGATIAETAGRLARVNPAEAAAALIIDEALRGGVVDIVVAPGQRSAPLAVAAATAAADGACHLHVRVDERSAGYLAVGLARATGAPVAVICTSGTAVTNLLPAVAEADASDLPLVLLTADRPAELLGVGANQTIDQTGVFGSRVRMAVGLEAPQWRDGVARYWRSAVCQAINAATDAVAPGPVHLNVALREPLLGGDTAADVTQDDADQVGLTGRPAGLPWTVDARLVSVASLSLDSLLDQLDLRPRPLRGVVVVGDLPAGEPYPSEATLLAETLNWPLLCEPSGNAHDGGTVVSHGPVLCAIGAFLEQHRPELVVTVGRVGLSRGVNALIASADLHIAVDPRPARTPLDPQRTAAVVVAAVPAPADSCRAPDDWTEAWLRADDLAEEAIAEVLADAPFSGVAVARAVWAAADLTGLLLAAASWPVRFLDSYAPVRVDVPWVVGNRGVSGIDGLVSTAWGAAAGHQRAPSPWDEAMAALSETGPTQIGGPGLALLGDLATLHDVNGLLAPEVEPRPDLTYVVIDNDGGGIFSSVAAGQHAYSQHFERVFGTPTGRDIGAYAEAAGVTALRVGAVDELAAVLGQATTGAGVQMVVCRVAERTAEKALLERLREAVAARLGATG
ncbi:MAG: 2-succinyl-5-enolpyruvyl-6-hydroxy-3-cyclohexene-carboxylate synthase [Actinomycetota bacterium]|nr:2-succinyl-5-enolpyruvyl-6-hydroxy-3-cyclohexene-carboxylate synthase [Actinomycetota bacterium]